METQNSTIGSAGQFKQMPTKNTETCPMPAHSDPKSGFMGEDMGVSGRMKGYKTPTNTE